MYKKEAFIASSPRAQILAMRGEGIKGVLTLKEAQDRVNRTRYVEVVTSITDNAFFFTDDYCFGHGVLPKHYVPSSTKLPMEVTKRETLPSGLVTDIHEFIAIFQDGYKLITSVDQLVDFLNGKQKK